MKLVTLLTIALVTIVLISMFNAVDSISGNFLYNAFVPLY